jgi:hypothetical protein
MVFPIAGGTQDTGYEISNSLRFDGSSSYLYHTHESGNKDTFTFSSWIKFGDLDNDTSADVLFSVTNTGYVIIRFEDKQLDYLDYDGSDVKSVSTNRLFRDVSAWYHIVVAIDMTQSTDSNKVKLYVNGSQESSFATATYQPTNQDTVVNTAAEHRIGRESGNYFSGYMADVNFIDGTAYDSSYFGETNDNGVWIPKKFTGSYGTNGYFLEFKQTGTSANASGIGADTSGQGNHHSVSGLAATDVTEDTPTNNFATFNPLDNDTITGAASFSEGNLVINANSDAQSGCPTTIAVSNGAWYIEGKCLSSTFEIGVFGYGDGFSFNLANHPPYGDNGYPFAYNYGGNLTINNSNSQTSVGTFTTNDILAIALDMDNNTIKFFKNGSQVGSTITDSNLSTFAPYSFYVANHTGSNTNMFSLNTGNPAYTISSGNTDGKYGNFEYAPPSGYYALCTKRLAEFG